MTKTIEERVFLTDEEIKALCDKYGAIELKAPNHYIPGPDKTDHIGELRSNIKDYIDQISEDLLSSTALLDNDFLAERVFGEDADKLGCCTIANCKFRLKKFEEAMEKSFADEDKVMKYMKRYDGVHLHLRNKARMCRGEYKNYVMDYYTDRAATNSGLAVYIHNFITKEFFMDYEYKEPEPVNPEDVYGKYYVEDDTGYRFFSSYNLEEAFEYITEPMSHRFVGDEAAETQELDSYTELIKSIAIDITEEYRPTLYVVERQNAGMPTMSKYEIKGGIVK